MDHLSFIIYDLTEKIKVKWARKDIVVIKFKMLFMWMEKSLDKTFIVFWIDPCNICCWNLMKENQQCLSIQFPGTEILTTSNQNLNEQTKPSDNETKFSFAVLKPWFQSASFAYNKQTKNLTKKRIWDLFNVKRSCMSGGSNLMFICTI